VAGFFGRAVKAPVGGAGNQEKETITMSQQPAQKFRFANLQVTVWRNVSEKGAWYSAVPTRSYKKGDDAWAESDSLGTDDLLPMAELLRQAFAWIARQMQADAKARRARQEANTSVE
jgi:hypothetical protein